MNRKIAIGVAALMLVAGPVGAQVPEVSEAEMNEYGALLKGLSYRENPTCPHNANVSGGKPAPDTSASSESQLQAGVAAS